MRPREYAERCGDNCSRGVWLLNRILRTTSSQQSVSPTLISVRNIQQHVPSSNQALLLLSCAYSVCHLPYRPRCIPLSRFVFRFLFFPSPLPFFLAKAQMQVCLTLSRHRTCLNRKRCGIPVQSSRGKQLSVTEHRHHRCPTTARTSSSSGQIQPPPECFLTPTPCSRAGHKSSCWVRSRTARHQVPRTGTCRSL